MENTDEVQVPKGVTGLVVLFEYAGAARDVILGLKHNRQVASVPRLADELAAVVRRASWVSTPAVITWVPTTKARRSERGYDQSLLLAKALARRLGLPCRRLLLREGGPQEGLDAAARRDGPCFVARRRLGQSVLVVDDVVTTGGTLAAAASVLLDAGAPDVYGAALSFTPPHRAGAALRTRTMR